MIPRTVQMAKEVKAQLSSSQLAQYGNIIAPTYRGWQNNSLEYYTNLTNTYGVYPGAPTMFSYWVNGFAPFQGPVKTFIGPINGGSGYTVGYYPAQPLTGGSGSGVVANITVEDLGYDTAVTGMTLTSGGSGYPASAASGIPCDGGSGTGLTVNGSGNVAFPNDFMFVSINNGGAGYKVGDVVYPQFGSGTGATMTVTSVLSSTGGQVTAVELVAGGSGFEVGESLTAPLAGGTGFSVVIGQIEKPYTAGGEPQWAMPPARMNQQKVLPTNQGPAVNNPAAIQYSFIYPRPNNPVAPPIGNLS